MLAKKRNHDGILILETLSQVDVTYSSLEKFTLSDAKDAAGLALADGESGDEKEEQCSAGRVKLPEEPAEGKAWDFYDSQVADCRAVSGVQAIHNL